MSLIPSGPSFSVPIFKPQTLQSAHEFRKKFYPLEPLKINHFWENWDSDPPLPTVNQVIDFFDSLDNFDAIAPESTLNLDLPLTRKESRRKKGPFNKMKPKKKNPKESDTSHPSHRKNFVTIYETVLSKTPLPTFSMDRMIQDAKEFPSLDLFMILTKDYPMLIRLASEKKVAQLYRELDHYPYRELILDMGKDLHINMLKEMSAQSNVDMNLYAIISDSFASCYKRHKRMAQSQRCVQTISKFLESSPSILKTSVTHPQDVIFFLDENDTFKSLSKSAYSILLNDLDTPLEWKSFLKLLARELFAREFKVSKSYEQWMAMSEQWPHVFQVAQSGSVPDLIEELKENPDKVAITNRGKLVYESLRWRDKLFGIPKELKPLYSSSMKLKNVLEIYNRHGQTDINSKVIERMLELVEAFPINIVELASSDPVQFVEVVQKSGRLKEMSGSARYILNYKIRSPPGWADLLKVLNSYRNFIRTKKKTSP